MSLLRVSLTPAILRIVFKFFEIGERCHNLSYGRVIDRTHSGVPSDVLDYFPYKRTDTICYWVYCGTRSGSKVNARCAWRAFSAKYLKMRAIAEFVSQISTLMICFIAPLNVFLRMLPLSAVQIDLSWSELGKKMLRFARVMSDFSTFSFTDFNAHARDGELWCVLASTPCSDKMNDDSPELHVGLNVSPLHLLTTLCESKRKSRICCWAIGMIRSLSICTCNCDHSLIINPFRGTRAQCW